jgi:hypothetical protein
MSTNIVPFKGRNLVEYEFKLADEDINLMSRDAVKALLPDILSRVLARSWIDQNYKNKLEDNVLTTLAEGGVYLPEDYECKYEKSSGQRAKISIYEITGKLRLKVCSLSLTMVATR